MQKLNATKLIEFKGLSERRKQTFVNNLKKSPKQKDETEGGGGDYWVSTTSALGHAWEENDNQFIEDKILELSAKLKTETKSIVRLRLQQNIAMLSNYLDFDFNKIRGKNVFNIKWVPKNTAPLYIKDLFVLALPNLVFNYKNKGETEAGVIWFAAQKYGYRSDELSVLAELAHRYASNHFRKKFTINPSSCIVLDVKTGTVHRYSDALEQKASSHVVPILNDINRFL